MVDRFVERGEGEHTVILLRHGESMWNRDNRFCGWVDVGLSEAGKREAATAGEAIVASGLRPTVAFTSLLARAATTLDTLVEKAGLEDLATVRDWRLNERHYGALTGLNKAACVDTWGPEQVAVWRRSYATPPPPMDDNHPFYQQILAQPWVASLPPGSLPRTESLQDLVARTVPFWRQQVEPRIREGETVLCVAHGTSLRGVVKHLEGISHKDICSLDLPNGIPIVYRLDRQLRVVGPRQYLADQETVRKAVEKVANIGKSSQESTTASR